MTSILAKNREMFKWLTTMGIDRRLVQNLSLMEEDGWIRVHFPSIDIDSQCKTWDGEIVITMKVPMSPRRVINSIVAYVGKVKEIRMDGDDVLVIRWGGDRFY